MGNPYAPKSKATEANVEVEPNDTRDVGTQPEPAVTESTTDSTPDANEVPDGPAAEVLSWVDGDKDRAQKALDAEEEGQQRVGLTKKLKELAE